MSATRPGQIDPIHGQAKPSKLRQRRKRIIVSPPSPKEAQVAGDPVFCVTGHPHAAPAEAKACDDKWNAQWVGLCGSCDAGIPTACTCIDAALTEGGAGGE